MIAPDASTLPGGRPQLVDQYGQPMRSKSDFPYDDFAVPQVITFTGLMGTAYHTYLQSRFDEARRIGWDNARDMLRDGRLVSLLQERQRAVRRLKWHLEVDDETDLEQQLCRDHLQKAILRYRSLKRLFKDHLWAIWFGRMGAQVKWDWAEIDGIRTLVPLKHVQVNGDKIGHHFDGTPWVLINTTELTKIPKAHTIYTDVAPAILLRGSWRERFIIHKHDVLDADYFDIDQAEQIHGVGVRHWLAWTDWLKREFLAWVVDYMERVGLGVTVYEYDASNPQDKAEVEKLAKEQNRRSVILWPRWPNRPGMGGAIQRIETPVAGADALLRMIQHIEEIEERLIVGQTASSRSETSGLGTHDTLMQAETKADIRDEDAENYEEALTGTEEEPGLVNTMFRWTFPEQCKRFGMRWKFDLESPDNEKKLKAVDTAAKLGVTFIMNEVRGLTGLSKPKKSDETIGGQPEQGSLDQPQQPGEAGAEQESEPGVAPNSNGKPHANGQQYDRFAEWLEYRRGMLDAGQELPDHYEAKHAPPGGVSIGGKQFTGGQFIPAEVMAKATPSERAQVERNSSTPRGPAPKKAGSFRGADWEKSLGLASPESTGKGGSANPSSAPTRKEPVLSAAGRSLKPHQVAIKKKMDGGINSAVLVETLDGYGIFKSAAGEEYERHGSPVRLGIPGDYYKRETAAWRVAEALGFDDLVPYTEEVEIAGKVGSLQRYVKNATEAKQSPDPFDGVEDLGRAALFDYIVGHQDRHARNWMVGEDGKLALIDNGLAFPESYHDADFFNYKLMGQAVATNAPLPSAAEMKGKWPQVEEGLKEAGLSETAIRLTRERFRHAMLMMGRAEREGRQLNIGELPGFTDGFDSLGDMMEKRNKEIAEYERQRAWAEQQARQ